MILGEQKNFDSIGFYEGDELTNYGNKVKEITDRYEKMNMQYIIFVDLLGASPFNASAIALAAKDSRIVTGVNLPMILEVLMNRNDSSDIDALLKNALASSRDSMKIINTKIDLEGEVKK